jgi:hypothetical protein
MIAVFLNNPYANSRLGNRRFGKYADEHRGRVRAATDLPATVMAPLDDVDKAYGTFMTSEKTHAIASAVRQGKTVTNDSAIRRLQRYVTQQAAIIAGQLRDPETGVRGEDTALYQVFFPKGVPALTQANKANIETEAAAFLQALETNPGYGSPGIAAKFAALFADVVNSRTLQLGDEGKGGEQTTDTGRDAARKTLALALYRLLLALLTHHAEDPAQIAQYFNQGILRETSGGKPTPPPAG